MGGFSFYSHVSNIAQVNYLVVFPEASLKLGANARAEITLLQHKDAGLGQTMKI